MMDVTVPPSTRPCSLWCVDRQSTLGDQVAVSQPSSRYIRVVQGHAPALSV